MIPKVIHYCWFGNNNKPDLVKRCIESWKAYLPEYEIKEWNESNFDVNCCIYVKQAYEAKKWAFVSDVARLWIIYNEGGIYLDTDVELFNNLDEFLKYSCWFASDDIRYINTGLGFGAEKGHYLIKEILEDYYNREFDYIICNTLNTNVIEKVVPSFKRDGTSKVIDNIRFIGMWDYGKYAKHYESNSWADPEELERRIKRRGKCWKLKCFLRNAKLINYLESSGKKRLVKIYLFFAYDFLDYGPIYFLERFIKKIKCK